MARAGSPSLGLFLLEGQRAVLEGMALRPAAPLLRRAARGEGQPVLVLPGFMADDVSTRVLRGFLNRKGFAAHPWLQGTNLGLGDGVRERLTERVDELHRRYDRKIAIVGWSLGGVYAREIAKRNPSPVRQVVSLGSPFGDVARPSSLTRIFDLVAQRRVEANDEETISRAARAREIRKPPPPSVPSTAIYSKTDGVVHWSTCLEPKTHHTENIEVRGSHCGLGVNPRVLYLVADRLSQPEGLWSPFDPFGRTWQRAADR